MNDSNLQPNKQHAETFLTRLLATGFGMNGVPTVVATVKVKQPISGLLSAITSGIQ